ncbi:MAG: ABC transporter permease [Actinomycetota bacterium]
MLGISLRSALAHRLRLALTALAVMLGVTFVTGTLTYTDALNRVFTSMVEEGTAGVDVYVAPKMEFESLIDYGAGGPGLPESMVETVASVPGVAVASGAVTGYAQFVDKKGKAITPFGPPTLGISWTEDPGLSSVRLTDGRAPSGPDEVLMDADTARDHGFEVGDQVEVLLQGPKVTFDLVGIIDTPSGSGFGGATMAAFDLETAQRLFKKKDRVDQIEVAAEEGTSATELRNLLAAELPDNVELKTGAAQAEETKRQIQQGFGYFTTVLLVFAAVAVFVGAFIIFNTFSIIVAQRTKEFGLLRAIGASGRQVTASVLVEAALIAAVASTLGIAAGLALAVGLQNLMDAVGIDLPPATLEWLPGRSWSGSWSASG